MTQFNRRQILAASSLVCMPHLAFAADPYPSKAIRLITPNSAGSGADGMARRIADHMGKVLKQPVFVENQPGAGGLLGTRTCCAHSRTATRSAWSIRTTSCSPTSTRNSRSTR